MSPNQPKTPVSNFRLTDETRAHLKDIAERLGTTMTGALVAATEAMTKMSEVSAQQDSRYPIEAHHAALGAFRDAMGYEPGQVIPRDVVEMVDRVTIAANPIIREAQHYETLRGVVAELMEMGADARVIAHFEDQMPPSGGV